MISENVIFKHVNLFPDYLFVIGHRNEFIVNKQTSGKYSNLSIVGIRVSTGDG